MNKITVRGRFDYFQSHEFPALVAVGHLDSSGAFPFLTYVENDYEAIKLIDLFTRVLEVVK